MKKTLVGIGIALACLQGCSTYSNTTNTSGDSPTSAYADQKASATVALKTLVDAYTEEFLPRNPINAMFMGDNRFNHLWPNYLSQSFIDETLAADKTYLTKLKQIDINKLSGQDVFTYEIFKMNLKNSLEGDQFPGELLPINQFVFSPHNFFMQLGSGMSAQPFNNAQDFDNFLARSEAFVVWMDQAIVNMRQGIQEKVVLPRPVVESIIPQLKAQILDNAEDSMLFTPLNRAGDKLNDAEKARLIKEYTDFITTKLSPVFARMAKFVEQEYLPHARETHGYGQLPNGKKWYEFAIKQNTTLPLSADDIHTTGLSEVERIHNEIREIAKEVGFKGDLRAFFDHLKTDPQFYFNSSEEVLQAYTDVKAKMAPKISTLFSINPKADYILRSYPEAQAKSAPGASYIPGAPDGSRPGVFFANTYNLKAQPKYGVETLSIHEAVPGHHFQLSIQSELPELPMLRKMNFYSVYAEGWALYAESLGKEMGMFTDPYQYFGKLSAELFRAMRLVVDTGIHSKGWTRQQAIDYMLENSDMVESDITSEIERYMVMPGQATSYKVGQLKIQQLREYAEKALGDKFDIKTFHNLLLLDGSLPMPLLERKIRNWVEKA